MSKVLVTGGAGYIGSHTCVELAAAGHELVVVDNFINSHPAALDRVRAITGTGLVACGADIRDTAALEDIMRRHGVTSVIHFAGLKAVGESVQKPLEYYSANVIGTHSLLTAMLASGARNIIFSSSATVYGDPAYLPLDEAHPLSATNPYGRTKLHIEEMLRDLVASGANARYGILRYFNPVGAHESGQIGEDPQGIPNNLMPFIAQVAVGRRERLSVYGADYDTPDGTGVRDYIHVVDLARAHVRALERVEETGESLTVNLGTGQGYSVLDVIGAFSRASNKAIPYDIVDRRPGDIASSYADPSHAAEILNWTAERGIEEMCRDHWRWQSGNPQGYSGEGS